MMRLLGAAFLVLAAFSTQVLAAPQVKIGTVDLQRAVTESAEGTKARGDLLKKKDQLAAQLKTALAELEQMKAELDKGTLPQQERVEKERLFQKKGREYQNLQREAQDDLKLVESDFLKTLLAKFGVILAKLGEEENYSLILDRNAGVFYAGPKIDLTPSLVKRADEEYQKKK
jgi:outer membrane protein